MNNQEYLALVDDSEDDHMLFSLTYKKMGDHVGLKLRQFYSGEEFYEVLCKEFPFMPKIVLLDINMPSINGFDTLKKIREDSRFSDIPVLLMFTNSDNPKDIEKASQLGANGFETKPREINGYRPLFDKISKILTKGQRVA